MSKPISKDPSAFLRVRVEVSPPVKDIIFTVPAILKPGALKALDDIRSLFGLKGQNWITGTEVEHYEKGDEHPETGKTLTRTFDGYCLIGSIRKINGRYEGIARAAIALAILEYRELRKDKLDGVTDEEGGSDLQDELLDTEFITSYNDDEATWKDISAVLKRAKKLVQQAPVK